MSNSHPTLHQSGQLIARNGTDNSKVNDFQEGIGSTQDKKDWHPAQISAIQGRLGRHLGAELITDRPAPGGGRVAYIEGWQAIALANDTFGFDGWSTEIKSIQIDHQGEQNKRHTILISAIVRVTLKNGTYHEDIGCGSAENSSSRTQAFEKAKKEAVTDALKRTLRQFGNGLGNCLYDRAYSTRIIRSKSAKRKWDESEFIHTTDFDAGKREIEEWEQNQQFGPYDSQNHLMKSIPARSNTAPPFESGVAEKLAGLKRSSPDSTIIQPSPRKMISPGSSKNQGPRSVRRNNGSPLKTESKTEEAVIKNENNNLSDWDSDFDDDLIFPPDEFDIPAFTKPVENEETLTEEQKPLELEKTNNTANNNTNPNTEVANTPDESKKQLTEKPDSSNDSEKENEYFFKNDKSQHTPNSNSKPIHHEITFFKATAATKILNDDVVPSDLEFDPSFESPIRRTLAHNKSVKIYRSEVSDIVSSKTSPAAKTPLLPTSSNNQQNKTTNGVSTSSNGNGNLVRRSNSPINSSSSSRSSRSSTPTNTTNGKSLANQTNGINDSVAFLEADAPSPHSSSSTGNSSNTTSLQVNNEALTKPSTITTPSPSNGISTTIAGVPNGFQGGNRAFGSPRNGSRTLGMPPPHNQPVLRNKRYNNPNTTSRKSS